MLGSNVNRMVPLAGSRLSAFGVSENMQGVMKAESEEPARITKPESRKS